MVNSQVDPLPDLEGDEPRSLGDALKEYIIYYNYFKTILIYNIQGIQGERFLQTLMKLISDRGGFSYLNYIQEREAYTVNVAASQLGLDINKLYSYTKAFVNMGVLVKAGKLGSKERGPPSYIYALRDASQSRIDEAAQLYKDVNSSHITSLDDYTVKAHEETYHRVAEEAVRSHVDHMGRVEFQAVVKLLSESGLYGEPHLQEMRQTLHVMGYSVIS